MGFSITHVSGAMEPDPRRAALRALVEELAAADVEHPDVAVTHDSGWTLSAFLDGRLVWENVEGDDGEPRHLVQVGRQELVRLFEALADGDVAAVDSEAWQPGY